MSDDLRFSKGRACAVAGLAALLLAGCASSTQYQPQRNIAILPEQGATAPRGALGDKVSDTLTQLLERPGDFSPNDLVRIRFPYMPLLDSEQRVLVSGEISPPLLKPMQTRGLTATELQEKLQALYRPVLERPSVSVQVLEYARPPLPPETFVMGEVARPGAFPYRDGSSLFEALARAGGASRDADLSQVVLLTPVKGQLLAEMIDLRAVLDGSSAQLRELKPFSVIIIPATQVARMADRARQIRQIIGFNGINLGSNVTLVSP